MTQQQVGTILWGRDWVFFHYPSFYLGLRIQTTMTEVKMEHLEKEKSFFPTVLFCGLIYLILHVLCGRLDLVPQICFMRVKNSTVTVHYRQHSTYVCKLVRRRRIQMKTYYSPFSRTGVEFLLYFFLS